MHSSERWRTHILVVLSYLLLAWVLTWPLVAQGANHVPGNGVDDPPLTWNLWWVKHALLDIGSNPFDCDYLFYPLGINLAFYTLTLLNGLLSLPLQAILGLVPASNVLLLSSFVLGAYGAFLLAIEVLAQGEAENGESVRSRAHQFAAFCAGVVYGFASSKLAYAALGQWNIASSQWIPFYILCLVRLGKYPHAWRYGLWASLFLLLQAYAELTYASFLVLFTLFWAGWHIVSHWLRSAYAEAGRLLARLVLVAGLFVLGLLPVLVMMLPDMRAEGGILSSGGGFADTFSADLLGFFVPTMYHPLLGRIVLRFDFDHTVGQHLYLGYAMLVPVLLAIARRWRDPHVRFWAVSALVFGLLTLGPSLRVNGQSIGLVLPFAWISRLPFFEGNRYPSRYGVLLMLSWAVLTAQGVLVILSNPARCRSAGLAILLTLIFVGEHLSAPLPMSDMRVPSVYAALAEQELGGTLLDIPVAWRNGARVTGTQDPLIMFEQYYQSAHQMRLLAGNTSRNPLRTFQYFTEAPLINTILALETGHSVDRTVLERDRQLASDVLRFFDITAILVHEPQAGSEMRAYVESVLPVEAFWQESETSGYRVSLPPWPSLWSIVPGKDVARLSYAEGWGLPSDGVIWAQRPLVRLLVPANGDCQRMTFAAYGPQDGQTLAVSVNGNPVQTLALTEGWADYVLDLPAAVMHVGLNEIHMSFDVQVPASSVRLDSRRIGSTTVKAPTNLVIQSAGQEVGDFAHIYVDGVQVASNERGYNVVVLEPNTGAVESSASFDTHLDPEASSSLFTFLTAVPEGRIVLVAVADEASRFLGHDAVQALQSIGATGDLTDRFRWGHAIVGLQGAPAGTAAERLDWMRPVDLVIGQGLTEPHVSAAFGTITVAAVP